MLDGDLSQAVSGYNFFFIAMSDDESPKLLDMHGYIDMHLEVLTWSIDETGAAQIWYESLSTHLCRDEDLAGLIFEEGDDIRLAWFPFYYCIDDLSKLSFYSI